ncbi:hypothetical protein Hanom_Chr07g00657331 [Helianthus anomalus]
MFKNFVMANQYLSSKLCEALYTKCEDQMDQLQVLRLPSTNFKYSDYRRWPSLTHASFNATKVMEKSAFWHLKPYRSNEW